MSYKTVNSILRGRWLVNQEWANTQLPIIARLIKGEPVNFKADWQEPENPQEHHPTALPIEQENVGLSIGVLNIVGPVTKYNGECGEPGSLSLADKFKDLNEDESIAAIILNIDSPGGEVDGTQTFADAVAGKKKPVYAFINDGLMCSAAYWMGCNADKIFSSHATNKIGSIGVYCTLYDFKEYFAQQGINVIEVYSNYSKDKNKPYREAVAGNTKPLQLELDAIAETFINAVKAARPGINTDVFSGGTYSATEAIELGLIDAVGSFDDLVGYAIDNHKTNNKMFATKIKGLTALKGVEAKDISAEKIEALNAELSNSGIKGLTFANADAFASFEADKKAFEQARAAFEAEKETATNNATAVVTLTEKNTELAGEVERLNVVIAAYGKKPGANITNAGKAADKLENPNDELLTSVDREAAELRAREAK